MIENNKKNMSKNSKYLCEKLGRCLCVLQKCPLNDLAHNMQISSQTEKTVLSKQKVFFCILAVGVILQGESIMSPEMDSKLIKVDIIGRPRHCCFLLSLSFTFLLLYCLSFSVLSRQCQMLHHHRHQQLRCGYFT